MIVRLAREPDLFGFLALAAQVEQWFEPMADDPGFSEAVVAHIRSAKALVAVDQPEAAGPGAGQPDTVPAAPSRAR